VALNDCECEARKKAVSPAIPWREISGFRNILVHNYPGNTGYFG
jgi:uncharacterized protein with HEPN domain